MINDTTFSANVTTYRDYLRRCQNFEEPVSGTTPAILLALLRENYKDCGSYMYEINKY